MHTKSIAVSDEAYRVFRRGAETAGVTDETWLRRLIGLNGKEQAEKTLARHEAATQAKPADDGLIPVYAVYRGQRVEGVFDAATTAITITSGPEAINSKTFHKPSPAATAAVSALNPRRRHPNTDGWL